jgi:hypothetical protein
MRDLQKDVQIHPEYQLQEVREMHSNSKKKVTFVFLLYVKAALFALNDAQSRGVKHQTSPKLEAPR